MAVRNSKVRTLGESAMRWSVISGGGWLVGLLVVVGSHAVIEQLGPTSTFADILMKVVLIAWMALAIFAPFGLAYASLLTIRCLRQRGKDAWQRSDAQDAFRVNLLAWIFGGFPSLLVCLGLLFVWLLPNS
jgi:hypothetical protein